MACCPRCRVPVVPTFAFRGAEFYCLDCGAKLGWLEPLARTVTPELQTDYDERLAEWREHAGNHLITTGMWHKDCDRCDDGRGSQHHEHATGDEWEAHGRALKWIASRRTVDRG